VDASTLVPIALGAALGVVGTLLTTWFAHRREQAALDRREWGAVPVGVFRGAVRDIISELVSAKTLLREALDRGRWWNVGDMRLERFETRREQLVAGLGDPAWARLDEAYRNLKWLNRQALEAAATEGASVPFQSTNIQEAVGLCNVAIFKLDEQEARLKALAVVRHMHRVGTMPEPRRSRRSHRRLRRYLS
jgi:hypothetical protein